MKLEEKKQLAADIYKAVIEVLRQHGVSDEAREEAFQKTQIVEGIIFMAQSEREMQRYIAYGESNVCSMIQYLMKYTGCKLRPLCEMHIPIDAEKLAGYVA